MCSYHNRYARAYAHCHRCGEATRQPLKRRLRNAAAGVRYAHCRTGRATCSRWRRTLPLIGCEEGALLRYLPTAAARCNGWRTMAFIRVGSETSGCGPVTVGLLRSFCSLTYLSPLLRCRALLYAAMAWRCLSGEERRRNAAAHAAPCRALRRGAAHRAHLLKAERRQAFCCAEVYLPVQATLPQAGGRHCCCEERAMPVCA